MCGNATPTFTKPCPFSGVSYLYLQWNLTNPNSLGPELVQISEMFGLRNNTFEWGS